MITPPRNSIEELIAAGGGGAAGLIPVSSTTFGEVASATISGFDSTARVWLVVLTRLQPSLDNARLQCEFRLGGSFPSDNQYEHHTRMTTPESGAGYIGASAIAAAVVALSGGLGQSAGSGLWGDLTFIITSPAVTDQRKLVRYDGSIWTVTTPNIRAINGHAVHATSDAALDAIRISYNVLNIAAGLIADVYKYDTP